MKKIRCKLLGFAAAGSLFLTLASPVFAVWSNVVTVTPQPWGNEIDSNVSVKKTQTDRNWSITGVQEFNSLDPYARLTVGGVTKSGWGVIRHSQTFTYSDNAAIKGNSVKTRAKSNNLEPSKNQIKYQFNPY